MIANAVPFLPGGADYHIEGLISQLKKRGHEVCGLRVPFNFSSYSQMVSLMDFCEQQDFNYFNGLPIDQLISLQFPTWGVKHDKHCCWLMHQHRVAYELYDKQPESQALNDFRDKVISFDQRSLSGVNKLFANSQTVAKRLKQFNGLDAQPLYHPPHGEKNFYCEEPYDYIFYPSRFESLKRQSLLIEAARYLTSPVKMILAGDGPRRVHCQSLIDRYDLSQRIKLTGHISEAQKLSYYARALAVYYGPHDEDYGYVTLEAMLSSKPVITTSDAGGPLEFIQDGENGCVVEPEPRAIAQVIDELYQNKKQCREMGRCGRQGYAEKSISWQHVIDTLLS